MRATVLRGVPAAKLDEPAIKLERAQWMRRTGSLDDAKALLAKPVANQNDAWWNERNQVARDLLAAGRAADAYAIVVPHGLTQGRGLRRGRVPGRLDRAAPSQEARRGAEAFPDAA